MSDVPSLFGIVGIFVICVPGLTWLLVAMAKERKKG